MPVSSSADAPAGATSVRALMVAIAFYTPLHAVAVAVLLTAPWTLGAGRWSPAAGLALLYLVPPLAARLLLRSQDRVGARAPVGSGAFLRWWALAQLQIVFSRLGALEELMRLLPGLYSAWLRLWGARVGRLVYWAPGVFITDRYLLEVGDRVVVGAGTRIVGHLITGPDGGHELLTAPVVIGSGAVVGGFSMLGPGARIGEDQTPPALTVLSPFWTWSGGRRRFAPGGAQAAAAVVAGSDE